MDFSNFTPQDIFHFSIYFFISMVILGIAANIRRTIRVKKLAHGAIENTK